MTNRSITNSSPLFVTGMPRSGTTFLQHLLSSHPEITICGQEPKGVCWGEWLQTLLEGVSFTHQANQETQETPPHYACSLNERETASLFLTFLRQYLAGEVTTPRWGLKSLTNCRLTPEVIRNIWPETRWIVCVRDPFRSMNSLRNTFDRGSQISWGQMSEWWTEAVKFALKHPDAMMIQIDRLDSVESRQAMVKSLFAFIGNEPTDAVWEFVVEWPVIHKVVPDSERESPLDVSERTALLENNHEFSRLATKMGYVTPQKEQEAR